MGLSQPMTDWSYRSYGSGPRIFVGLHGWNGNRHSFDSLLPFLPDDVTLIALDLPGYGESKRPAQWHASGIMDAFGEQVASLQLTSFTIIGNCSGGLLGMWLLKDQPTLPVERIVLIDTFGFMPWYFQIFLAPFAGPLFYYSTFANPVGRWLTNRSLQRMQNHNTDMTKSFSQAPVSVPFHYLRLFRDMGDYRSFQHVQTPVDLAYGEHTFGAVKQSIPMWKTLWPDANVLELQGAGHLSVQEAPEPLSRFVFDPSSPDSSASLP
ncbi:MAG: alpha/beta fold hydrolase [Deltaproteobacteria bacterium]|nr:MAG: alpha/beta fold hydrolase [Deltaproteobacteria bacterium]